MRTCSQLCLQECSWHGVLEGAHHFNLNSCRYFLLQGKITEQTVWEVGWLSRQTKAATVSKICTSSSHNLFPKVSFVITLLLCESFRRVVTSKSSTSSFVWAPHLSITNMTFWIFSMRWSNKRLQRWRVKQKVGVRKADINLLLKPRGGSPSPLCLHMLTFNSQQRDNPRPPHHHHHHPTHTHSLSLPPFEPQGSWGAKNRGGSSLQQGADSACSPSLNSAPSDGDTDCCLVQATSGQPHYVLRRRDARSDQSMFHLRWALAGSTYRPSLLQRGRDSMVVVVGESKPEENNRLQWDVFKKQRIGSWATARSCFSLPTSHFLPLQHSKNINKFHRFPDFGI